MTTDIFEFNGLAYPDARASDPRALGWMEGFPPPVDKQVTFASDQFFDFPRLRWSFSHMRELVPTAAVWRGDSTRVSLGTPSAADAAAIEALTFMDLDGRPHGWEDALYDTYTDGILVLHRGRVVYERYFGVLTPERPHAGFSITKSYVGPLAASLVHEGALDYSRTVSHYLPELRGTAWEGVTLGHVMDMKTGLAYSEDYDDPASDVWDYARSGGLLPKPRDYEGAHSLCEYLQTVQKSAPHGGAYAYQTVNTEVMAWVMARVTGRSFAEQLSERIWAPLGCEEDGSLIIDQAGMPMAGIGLSATVRDLARFGELMRREGDWNGKQLIPAAVVQEIQRGGNPADLAPVVPRVSRGSSYRNMWYVTHNDLGAFMAGGIHGQRLYVAPEAEMVVVRLSSHPNVLANALDPITSPMLSALGQMLRN